MSKRARLLAGLIAAGSLGVSGCGGGGGGGGGGPPANQAPAAAITAPAQAALTIDVGDSVTFTGTCTDPDDDLPLSYAWDFGGGAADSTSAAPGAVTFLTAGTFTVTFTCSDARGLADATPVSRSITVADVTPRTLRGTLVYDKVPVSPSGLDFANTVTRPIRGAVVELVSGTTVIGATVSGEDGSYAFSWTGPRMVRVRVKALTAVPVIRVEDNTAGDALYSMISAEVDNDSTATLSLRASSGWGGTSYTGPRVTAPFAILDAAYASARFFLAERAVPFPDLRVNWSIDNRPEEGDKSTGQIGTSHWDFFELYLLGKEDADTDEFDDHIIAHEWGHYFESKLSRADSPGGSHAFGQLKDPRLSWGEGWATALGAMVFHPDDLYVDTLGLRQATAGIYYSIEDNVAEDPTPGWFSEASVVHVFYDMWDPAGPGEPFDDVSVGAGAIYDDLVGFQKDTDAFTTLFSFVKGLLVADPSLEASMNALLAHRGVAAPITNEFAIGGETNDGGVAGALPVYTILAIDDPPSTVTFTGGGVTPPELNSLRENRFAFFHGNGGTVTLSAVAAGKAIGLELYEKGVKKGDVCDLTGAGTVSLPPFHTTAGAIYRVLISSFDESSTATYTATVSLSSP
jgi:PKD repeat protein